MEESGWVQIATPTNITDDARQFIDSLLNSDTLIDARIFEAALQVYVGSTSAAKALLSSAGDLSLQNRAFSLLIQAQIAYGAGQFSDAVEVLERAYDLDSPNPLIRMALGEVWRRGGDDIRACNEWKLAKSEWQLRQNAASPSADIFAPAGLLDVIEQLLSTCEESRSE